MARSYAPMSALQKIYADGISLTRYFNLSGGFADAANALYGSAAAAASNAGQTSAINLRPYTVEEKFDMLKRMLVQGQASLAPGISLEAIKDEMKKPENDGLGVRDMAAVLAEKKMLKFAAPKPVLKVRQPHLTPRMA